MYIKIYRPDVSLLEKVKLLGAKNIEAILRLLNFWGFFVIDFLDKAEPYGSASRRERVLS